mmetsp:Transcript_43482/g.116356  ORF Transcript_43482/g.116356 Transcript_43482/m.116356 type:complete len:264 (-) Transcript_43482:1202-1993(-)
MRAFFSVPDISWKVVNSAVCTDLEDKMPGLDSPSAHFSHPRVSSPSSDPEVQTRASIIVSNIFDEDGGPCMLSPKSPSLNMNASTSKGSDGNYVLSLPSLCSDSDSAPYQLDPDIQQSSGQTRQLIKGTTTSSDENSACLIPALSDYNLGHVHKNDLFSPNIHYPLLSENVEQHAVKQCEIELHHGDKQSPSALQWISKDRTTNFFVSTTSGISNDSLHVNLKEQQRAVLEAELQWVQEALAARKRLLRHTRTKPTRSTMSLK